MLASLLLSQDVSGDLTDRGPIHIDGNDGFNTTNGVVSGNGSSSGPFIIEGWAIDTTTEVALGIYNTDAHFIVRDVTLNGNDPAIPYAIELNSVKNGVISNVTVHIQGRDVRVRFCEQIALRDIATSSRVRCFFEKSKGIELSNSSFWGGSFGIYLRYTDDSEIRGCNVTDTQGPGIILYRSDRIQVAMCNSSNSGDNGLLVEDGESCSVRDSIFLNNDEIDVDVSTGSKVNMTGCTLGRRGLYLVPEGDHDIDLTNTVDGDILHYHVDESDRVLSKNVGQLILVRCDNFTVSDCVLDGPFMPVLLNGTTNSKFHNMTLKSGPNGFLVLHGGDLEFDNVSMSRWRFFNHGAGFNLRDVGPISINDTWITSTFMKGITVDNPWSKKTSVDITNVTMVRQADHGIHVYCGPTSVVNIYNATVSDCDTGIWVVCGRVSVLKCEIADSMYGMEVSGGVFAPPSQVMHNRISGGSYALKCSLYNGSVVGNNLVSGSKYYGAIHFGMGDYLSNNTVVDCPVGIHARADGSVLENNTVTRCARGFNIIGGETRIRNNLIDNSSEAGINFENYGFAFDVVVDECEIVDSTIGVQLKRHINNVDVLHCRMARCDRGLVCSSGFFILVEGCTFIDCPGLAVDFLNSGGSSFHHNNFIRCNYNASSSTYRGIQVFDYVTSNEWDDGSLGNYWSDYPLRYPDAIRSGRTWNIPYDINATLSVKDNHPLAIMYDFRPPTARPGEDLVIPQNSTARFDGTSSTDDMGIVNYTWTIAYPGGPFKLYGERASFTFDLPGGYIVRLTVRDEWGNEGNATLNVTVLDTAPPFAEAGPDIEVDMGQPFTLDATTSRDNVGIASYNWTVDPGGLDIHLTGPAAETSIGEPGDYVVLLNITYAAGNWAHDSLTVHVLDIVPPTADAGEDINVSQGDTVTLDGSGSSDNVGIAQWNWTFEYGGENVTLSGERVEFVFDMAGEYYVQLVVKDKYGLIAGDILVVRVRDTEPPVVVVGEDIGILQHRSALLDGGNCTDNVKISGYTWSFTYTGNPIQLWGRRVEFTFDEAGTYTILLNVTDTSGNWAVGSFNITVTDTEFPVADAGEDVLVDQGVALFLNGSSSTDNMQVARYVWSIHIGDDVEKLTGAVVAYTFETPGVFAVGLNVTDLEGNWDTDHLTVTVRDAEPPVADAGTDITVIQGTTARLSAEGSSDNVGIARYRWSFTYDGREEVGTNERLEFMFEVPGEYTVSLQVADGEGNADTDIVVVTVLPLNIRVRLGPFVSRDGTPVQDVEIKLVINNSRYSGVTDGTGWASFEVSRYSLGHQGAITAAKSGWQTLEYDSHLGGDGRWSDGPPVMVGEKTDSSDAWTVVIVMVLVAVVAVVASLLYLKGRRDGASTEPD